MSTRTAVWRSQNPEKVRVANARAYAKRKEEGYHRARHLRQKYGPTPSAFAAMLESQGAGCASCGTRDSGAREFSVDHCHQTGFVRGILRYGCNSALGMFREDPLVLRLRVAAWLDRPRPLRGEPRTAWRSTKERYLVRTYGVDERDIAVLVAQQAGACGICGAAKKLVVDHDHGSAGRRSVRGLLCDPCNRGLGFLREDPTVAAALAAYLDRVGSYSG